MNLGSALAAPSHGFGVLYKDPTIADHHKVAVHMLTCMSTTRNGKHNVICLVWIRLHLEDKTPVLLHENVLGFDWQLLVVARTEMGNLQMGNIY